MHPFHCDCVHSMHTRDLVSRVSRGNRAHAPNDVLIFGAEHGRDDAQQATGEQVLLRSVGLEGGSRLVHGLNREDVFE